MTKNQEVKRCPYSLHTIYLCGEQKPVFKESQGVSFVSQLSIPTQTIIFGFLDSFTQFGQFFAQF